MLALTAEWARGACDPSIASGTSGTGLVIGHGREPEAIPKVLSPQQALQAYQERALRQLATMAEYSDETLIEAELPSTSQSGRFWLQRTFSAPRSLAYRALDFAGDASIKNNVIARVLQSDVDRAQKGKTRDSVIVDDNYRFSYKGNEDLNGRLLYSYAVKPRRKDPDLFKGKILLDAQNGHIVQALGRLSQSPSWWIKRVEFRQDYADVGEFTMPVHTRSQARLRIFGPVLVSIRHSGYKVRSTEPAKTSRSLAGTHP
jgi:hypothetical protein